MAFNPETTTLLAHFDDVVGEGQFLDVYYNYEVLGTNSDQSTRIQETIYIEYDGNEITQQLITEDGQPKWYPEPRINRYTFRGYDARIQLYDTKDFPPEYPSLTYYLETNIHEQYDHYQTKTLKDVQVTQEPWEEVSSASGITYQYRKVKGIFREVITQRITNIPGSKNLVGKIWVYKDVHTANYAFWTSQNFPRIELYFSDYINITPTWEIYDDVNNIYFDLYNTNRDLKEVYVELVGSDKTQVIIPREMIDPNFSTLNYYFRWHDEGEESGGSRLARLYEYMYDKAECECYIQVGYRSSLTHNYTVSSAKIIIQLHEYRIGAEKDLYPIITCSVRDNNATTIALTGNNKHLVRYYSNAVARMTSKGVKGAEVTVERIRNSNVAFYTNYHVFERISDRGIYFDARDSRGNLTTAVDNEVVFLEYVRPTCNITNIGLPTVNDTCQIHLSGMYWNDNFGSTDNELTLWYRYKSTSIPDYVDWIKITDPRIEFLWDEPGYNAIVVVDLPNHIDKFTIQVMAKDQLESGTSGERSVRAEPIFDWNDQDFHFNIPVIIDGDLQVNGTITSNTPEEEVIEPADYIIEQGTRQTGSGNSLANWTFRKWNSGMYECWCRKHIQTSVSTAWGNLFVSGSLPHTNLIWPGAFIDIPVANITIAPNASGAFLIAGGSTSLSATLTGGYEIARGTSSSSGNYYINYYGMGRWK